MSALAVIGTGVMGETMIGGLLRAGWSAEDLIAADRYAGRRQEVQERHHVRVADTVEAVADAETILLVVKPQDLSGLLPEIAASLRAGALVVSLCAGVRIATLEQALPTDTPVVRVMPNTPAQVSAGMAALSAGSCAQQVHVERAVGIMSAVGAAVVVPESYQDAVTAVSGSGPAYLFLVAEAMIDAGVGLGLPRDVATTLTQQTLFGSAKLLVDSDDSATVLRERVTSPAGTTAAALGMLEERGLRAAFGAALRAARDRSAELGQV
ncbi:MAG: pyrroline-5-carboxylate reductase [Propioniciclava sp.]